MRRTAPKSAQLLICLIGNHDAAALGSIDLNAFNREARYSARWTQSMLTPSSRQYLNGLPERTVIRDVTLAHGSPRSPVWEYLLDPSSAYDNLPFFRTELCFIGHTHIPVAFRMIEGLDQMEVELLRDGDKPEISGLVVLKSRFDRPAARPRCTRRVCNFQSRNDDLEILPGGL